MTNALVVLAAVAVVVLLVARYGADSRTGGDPTGRDEAWPSTPTRPHTPRADVALLRAAIARTRAFVRCWELFEASLRPWESTDAAPRRIPSPRSAPSFR